MAFKIADMKEAFLVQWLIMLRKAGIHSGPEINAIGAFIDLRWSDSDLEESLKLYELENKITPADEEADETTRQLRNRVFELEGKLLVARGGLEYFIGRVEEGSIRSRTTYKKFKEILTVLDAK